MAKFPFSLTQKFKGMVQRGLTLNSLDVSYVTSSSIFFLFLFGSNGVFSLIFGSDTVDDAKLMQNQMTGGIQQQQQQMVDYGSVFKSEIENLELIEHDFYLDSSEERFIKCHQF
jgi:ER membrane protein complex subunit 3